MDWLVLVAALAGGAVSYSLWGVFANAAGSQTDEAKANQRFWWGVFRIGLAVAFLSGLGLVFLNRR